jgi:hypothetical protein
VPLPCPVPGLVIRYSYLWYSEHLAGREQGETVELASYDNCLLGVAEALGILLAAL